MTTIGHAAELHLDIGSGKWKAMFQGTLLAESPDRNYIIKTIERGLNKTARACGVTHVVDMTKRAPQELNGDTAEQLFTPPAGFRERPHFEIKERFDILVELTKMAISKDVNGVLVTGEGGLGKTHTVMSTIKEAGLTFTSDFEPPEIEVDADSEDPDEEILEWVNPGQVHVIKGYSSAKGLYRALWENNGKLIIFDDCDSIQKDPNAVNLLKGALDTHEERWVSWNAEEGRAAKKLPRRFLFTGRVIFISNWPLQKIDGNLRTRCMPIDLSMTTDEKLERMRHIIMENPSFLPDVSLEIKLDALDFLERHKDMASNLSIRSLLDAIRFRKTGSPTWERGALYCLAA